MKRRILLVWIACFVFLLSLAACGGGDTNNIIPGTWTGEWMYSNEGETIFYSDGTMEYFSSYQWSIINGSILKIEARGGEDVSKFTIDKINNKLMTLSYEDGRTVTLNKQ